MADDYAFEVRDKGRTVLPAGLRSACGFEPGSRLHAHQVGEGQALVETEEAILARIWADAPADTDGVADLRACRAAESVERPAPEIAGDYVETGEATLRALGLR